MAPSVIVITLTCALIVVSTSDAARTQDVPIAKAGVGKKVVMTQTVPIAKPGFSSVPTELIYTKPSTVVKGKPVAAATAAKQQPSAAGFAGSTQIKAPISKSAATKTGDKGDKNSIKENLYVGLLPRETYCKYDKNHEACIAHSPNEMKRCKGVFLQRGMTLKDAQDFLDNHNLARRLIARGEAFGHPQAANMAKLEWDNELASFVQLHLDQCPCYPHLGKEGDPCVHSTLSYMLTTPEPTPTDECFLLGGGVNPGLYENYTGRAVFDWFEEGQFVTPEYLLNKPGNEKPDIYKVGHFLNVINAANNRVGCAYIFHQHSIKNNALMACRYATVPVNGKPPKTDMGGGWYVEGKPCSKCKEYGYNGCDDGLCIP